VRRHSTRAACKHTWLLSAVASTILPSNQAKRSVQCRLCGRDQSGPVWDSRHHRPLHSGRVCRRWHSSPQPGRAASAPERYRRWGRGYFVVLRHQAFAGDALSDIAFTGVLGGAALGLNPLVTLLVTTIGVAVAMGGFGERLQGRDVAIGTVLAWVLELGTFFLSLFAS
jgi:hypothetical protein